MKQAIGALATLSVIFIFCIFSVTTVSRESDHALKLTEDAFSARDMQTAVAAIQKAEADIIMVIVAERNLRNYVNNQAVND